MARAAAVAGPARRPSTAGRAAAPSHRRVAVAAGAAAPARTPARRPAPARRSSPSPARRRRPAQGRPTLVQRTGALARARAVAGIEALLHGPGLIAIVFVLLVGVVFANVALLQRNRQITHDAARVSELKRDNATLRRDVAERGSSERIQQVAAERGLVLPAPDAVRYLRSNPRSDAVAAAKQIDAGTALAAAPVYTPPAYTAPAPVAPTTPTTPTAYGTTPTYGQADPDATPAPGTEIAGTPDAVADVTAGVP
jgi:cell division protein FtsL